MSTQQQSSGRWVLFAATTLAATIVVGGIYLLQQLSQRESYLEARNFRVLQEVAEQLRANLQHPGGLKDPNDARRARLQESPFYRGAKFRQCAQKAAVEVVNDRAFSWKAGAKTCVEISFNSLVDPSLALQHFQSIALARAGDGGVFYQSGGQSPAEARRGASDFLELSELALQSQSVAAEHPQLGSRDADPGPLLSVKASSVAPVSAGATDYLVFAIPFKPSVPPTEADRDWSDWVIAGVVDARAFKRAHWEVRRGYAALFLALLLLGVFAWPFVKLRFRGASESFRLGGLYVLLASGMLGGSLLVAGLAATRIYFETAAAFDDAAKALAHEIRDRLSQEIELAVLLNEIRASGKTDASIGKFGETVQAFIDDKDKVEPTYTPATTIGAGNDSLAPTIVFFVDRNGLLCGNILSTAVEQDIPNGLPLAARAYYREVARGEARRPGLPPAEQVFLDSIRSITTNELESVASFPAHSARNCTTNDSGEAHDSGVAVFAILLRLTSVEKAVLPHGFRFAVIHRDHGKVLYHSDDDRRDRERFFSAAGDRNDLHALMDSGAAGRPVFFYDGAENAGYLLPVDVGSEPLSVLVFYDKGLVDLFTIQTTAMAYALMCVLALWLLVLALCWQAIASSLGLRPWEFIWPRALPESLIATAGGVLVLLLFALYVSSATHPWKWVALLLLPIALFAWLYGWACYEARQGRKQAAMPGVLSLNASVAAPNRYRLRSVLLVASLVVVPSLLVFDDVREFQAYRYQLHARIAFTNAMQARSDALFSMTDGLCIEFTGSGDSTGPCTHAYQQDDGPARGSERARLAEALTQKGIYQDDYLGSPEDCLRWQDGFWPAQASRLPPLGELDRLVRATTGTRDGRLQCPGRGDLPSAGGNLYQGGSLNTVRVSALGAVAILTLLVIWYFSEIVGRYLFGVGLAGAPQDLPPVIPPRGQKRHLLIRVPEDDEEAERSGQKSLRQVREIILEANGITGEAAKEGATFDLSLPCDALQRLLSSLPGQLEALRHCRVVGFEPPLEDTKRRLLLLEIFEELYRAKDLVVMVEVSISPLFKLTQPNAYPRRAEAEAHNPTADEIRCWTHILADFEKYYGRPPVVPVLPTGEWQTVEDTIERECKAIFGLSKAEAAVTDWARQLKILDKHSLKHRAFVVRAIKDFMRGDYRRLWDQCTVAERVLLHGMATKDCAHPTHPATEHLMRRGLVRFDPVLRIANESFALFVLDAESPRQMREWRQQISSSAWFYIRVPLLIMLGIIGFFVVSYFSDVANVVAAGIPSTIAALTLLSRFFGRPGGA